MAPELIEKLCGWDVLGSTDRLLYSIVLYKSNY
jgi:hypothetical protein